MTADPPITIPIKMDLLENQKELRDQKFHMGNKRSPPSKVLKNYPLNPLTYLTNRPILNLKICE